MIDEFHHHACNDLHIVPPHSHQFPSTGHAASFSSMPSYYVIRKHLFVHYSMDHISPTNFFYMLLSIYLITFYLKFFICFALWETPNSVWPASILWKVFLTSSHSLLCDGCISIWYTILYTMVFLSVSSSMWTWVRSQSKDMLSN